MLLDLLPGRRIDLAIDIGVQEFLHLFVTDIHFG
jgi:hypothetical protein